MGIVLTVACYLITFSPSLALFCRFVAKDPLRIILFVLGAFLWLASLLLSSFIWTPHEFSISCCSRKHKGSFIGAASIAPGVSDLHNARHMLALVCGLGMGVMAALFLTMNVFAEFSGPGTMGLPKALRENKRDANFSGSYLPLYYALTGCLTSLFGVVWTIMIWDSCHKFRKKSLWALPAIAAVVSHFVASGLSWLNTSGYQPYVLGVQFLILLLCIVYAQIIMGATPASIAGGISSTFADWFTLKWLRQKLQGGGESFAPVEEIEADERRSVGT
ncbi:hypothetical protein Q1695_009835 [Nippostrongylus brasiliensis]|nr:hypothetical protein Q1695_009835 [Nippostrongylus brasiliensis]